MKNSRDYFENSLILELGAIILQSYGPFASLPIAAPTKDDT